MVSVVERLSVLRLKLFDVRLLESSLNNFHVSSVDFKRLICLGSSESHCSALQSIFSLEMRRLLFVVERWHEIEAVVRDFLLCESTMNFARKLRAGI